MLRRVDRRLVRVENLEAAVVYYRDVLRLKLTRQTRQLASFELADGSTELVLHANPDAPYDEIYYLVDDVRKIYEQRAKFKLKFLSPPSAVTRGYRATAKDPFGNILLLVDRSTESPNAADDIEDARSTDTLFPGVAAKLSPKKTDLIAIYERLGRTADDLPYTPHFETLHQSYANIFTDPKPDKYETWRHLLNIRKAGKLPKLGDARSTPPDITADERERLRSLLGDDIGKRDRLPYTKRFDEIAEAFNGKLSRPMAPHLIWRLIATLAK